MFEKYLQIYIYYFYIYVYVRNHEISDVPSRLPPHGFGHMRPKGISYHKTIVVVINKAHCFHEITYDKLKEYRKLIRSSKLIQSH